MDANISPTLPTKISALDLNTQKFPYVKVGLHVSAVWYWAVKAYSIYGYDRYIDNKSFRNMAIKFQRNIIPAVGKDWNKITHYIDWYLYTPDNFISTECKRGFEYMVSNHCINKYFENNPSITKTVILNDEDRLNSEWTRS